MIIKKETITPIIFFILLYTLILSYSLKFDFDKVIDGGDTDLSLNPKLSMDKFYSVWGDDGTGTGLPIPGISVIHSIPLYLLSIMWSNISKASLLYFILLFSLAPISMFLLTYEISKNRKISYFVSLFYSFNFYTAIESHTPIQHKLYFFGIIPLLILIFLKMVNVQGKRRVFFLMLYVLLFLPLLRVPQMYLILLFFIPTVSFILSDYTTKRFIGGFIKIVIVSSLLIFSASAPFILGTLQNISWVENTGSQNYVMSSFDISSQNQIIDALRSIRTYSWDMSRIHSFDEPSGIYTMTFARYYQENSLFIILSFYVVVLPIFLLILFYPKLKKSERFKVSLLSLIAILSIFLIQYTYTISQISTLISTAFRSPWQYFTPLYLLSLSLITTLLLSKTSDTLNKRNILIFFSLIIAIQIIYISPAFIGNPLHSSWTVEIPTDYYDVANFLNSQSEEFRILPLPLTKHFVGYTPYKWNYTGPDVLHTLTDKPIIDKYINTIAPNEYVELTKKLERVSPEDEIQLAKVLNVKYILLRSDIDEDHKYIKVTNSQEAYKNFLDNSSEIKNKYLFGNLTLYEVDSYYPRIFSVPINRSIERDSNFLNEILYRYENIIYFEFNETPLSLNVSRKYTAVNKINLSISFVLENKTDAGNWTEVNHGIIQTDFFKVAISPRGWMHIFIYLQNNTFIPVTKEIQTTELFNTNEKIKLDIILVNGTLSIYKNNWRINTTNISIDQIPNELDNIRIGSNFDNSEKLNGRLYNMSLIINNETIIDTATLYKHGQNKSTEFKKNNMPPYNQLNWHRVSPSKYKINIPNGTDTFYLIFLTTYSTKWKAYISNGTDNWQIPEENHIKFFDYANGWYVNKTGNYTITLEYEPQKWFYVGAAISITTLLACIGYLVYDWRRGKKPESKKSKKSWNSEWKPMKGDHTPLAHIPASYSRQRAANKLEDLEEYVRKIVQKIKDFIVEQKRYNYRRNDAYKKIKKLIE